MIGRWMKKCCKAWIEILAGEHYCVRKMAFLFGKCCEVCWVGFDSLTEAALIAALLGYRGILGVEYALNNGKVGTRTIEKVH